MMNARNRVSLIDDLIEDGVKAFHPDMDPTELAAKWELEIARKRILATLAHYGIRAARKESR